MQMFREMLATVQFAVNQIAWRDVLKRFGENKGSGTEEQMSS